jgi:hypothetical protein
MAIEIDYRALAAEQRDLEHLTPCRCTTGPWGYVSDYDCGRDIARNKRNAELAELRDELKAAGGPVRFRMITTTWLELSGAEAADVVQSIIDNRATMGLREAGSVISQQIDKHVELIKEHRGLWDFEMERATGVRAIQQYL